MARIPSSAGIDRLSSLWNKFIGFDDGMGRRASANPVEHNPPLGTGTMTRFDQGCPGARVAPLAAKYRRT